MTAFYLRLTDLKLGRIYKTYGPYETYDAASEAEDRLQLDYNEVAADIIETVEENDLG
jgi:hypothetical protein